MIARSVAVALAALALAAPAAGQSGPVHTVTVSREDCRNLVAHVPAPDAAYQPGVDVLGRPVAPADLNGTTFSLLDPLVVRIDVDLVDRLGLTPPPGVEPELTAAYITVSGNRVTFNGQPLVPNEVAALQAACTQALNRP
ncbi:MAG: hypothetical protein H6843_17780 [Rhodospirillaceae bacterium]|nr:hypothetical protein [Rhodospirillaceae bacterium]